MFCLFGTHQISSKNAKVFKVLSDGCCRWKNYQILHYSEDLKCLYSASEGLLHWLCLLSVWRHEEVRLCFRRPATLTVPSVCLETWGSEIVLQKACYIGCAFCLSGDMRKWDCASEGLLHWLSLLSVCLSVCLSQDMKKWDWDPIDRHKIRHCEVLLRFISLFRFHLLRWILCPYYTKLHAFTRRSWGKIR